MRAGVWASVDMMGEDDGRIVVVDCGMLASTIEAECNMQTHVIYTYVCMFCICIVFKFIDLKCMCFLTNWCNKRDNS